MLRGTDAGALGCARGVNSSVVGEHCAFTPPVLAIVRVLIKQKRRKGYRLAVAWACSERLQGAW